MSNKMSSPYRVGERKHSHKRLYIWLGSFLSVLVLGSVIGIRFLHADTHIGDTPAPVTRTITYDTPNVQVFEGATFKISLPNTWKVMPVSDTPTPTYTWHGTDKKTGDDARWIDVYVDADLQTFSINRVVSVQANGTGLSVTSDVSDNCTNFTGTPVGAGHTYVQAKWQNIAFLCETGNYTRDVVGTVSPDGLNTVNITGPTKGLHHYLFVYTDNSSSANYKIFTDALKTFVAK